MFAEEIRRQAETAPRAALPAVSAALWKAFAAGAVTEAEAEGLSALIEARKALPAPKTPQTPSGCARTALGSRPRTDASLERRRRWAASGRLPPGIAARFTLAEQAVLALVAAETARRGDCRLAVGHLAALVGVAETTVRNAIREARKLGLLTVEERRQTGWRSDTNVVRIVSPEWTAWLKLARRAPVPGTERRGGKGPKGGGCKSPNPMPTSNSKPVKSGTWKPQKGCRQAAGDLDQRGPSGTVAIRGDLQAMS